MFVAGQSGVGKSRLMREVRHQTQLSRVPFVESNCYEGSFAESAPLAEVFGFLVRLATALGGKHLVRRNGPELVKILPRLGLEWGIEPSSCLKDAEAERLRLLQQLCSFCVSVAGLCPYAFYINDLQWAQALTTDLLAHLARRIKAEPIPVALLGSFRDEEVEGRPLQRLLEGLEADQALQLVSLQPLQADDVASVLASMLGVDALPQAFCGRVIDETGGNPFSNSARSRPGWVASACLSTTDA